MTMTTLVLAGLLGAFTPPLLPGAVTEGGGGLEELAGQAAGDILMNSYKLVLDADEDTWLWGGGIDDTIYLRTGAADRFTLTNTTGLLAAGHIFGWTGRSTLASGSDLRLSMRDAAGTTGVTWLLAANAVTLRNLADSALGALTVGAFTATSSTVTTLSVSGGLGADLHADSYKLTLDTDDNSYIWASADDTMQLVVGGTNRLSIDTTEIKPALDVELGASNVLRWDGRSQLVSSGDLRISMRDTLGTTGVTWLLGTNTITLRNLADTANASLTASALTAVTVSGTIVQADAAGVYRFSTRTNIAASKNGALQIGMNGLASGVTLDVTGANILRIRNILDTADATVLADAVSTTSTANKGALTTHGPVVTQTLTCSGGSSYVTSGLIPDGAWLIGVSTRVTTALTGPTSYEVGNGSDADMYGAALATTQGTTSSNANATTTWANPQTSAGEITITTAGACSAGAWSVNAHYLTITPPQSN